MADLINRTLYVSVSLACWRVHIGFYKSRRIKKWEEDTIENQNDIPVLRWDFGDVGQLPRFG